MILQLETFFEVSLDLLCIRDREGRFVQVNPAWEATLGYRPDELKGVAILGLIHPDDVAATQGQMARVDGHPNAIADNFINRYRHRDGSYRYLEWRARQIGQLVYGAARDVTERIASERRQQALSAELEAERARLLKVQAVAKIGNWETDLTTHAMKWSGEIFRIFEQDPASSPLRHEDFLAIVHPEDRVAVAEAFSASLSSPEVFSIHHRLLMTDGRVKELEERWQVVPDANGGACRAIGTCQDITERYEELKRGRAQTEAALAATQAILDNSQDIICTIGGDGRIVQVNPRAEEIWGHSQDDLVGAEFLSLIHPDDREATLARALQLIGKGPAGGLANRCLSKTGAAIPMMWSASWSETHQLTFAVGRDMREQIASEAMLRQAQKMEAVGRLTGGVAHDFNNLLTIIVLSTEAVSEGLADRPDLLAHAQIALGAADRGQELIARLLAFSRNHPLLPEALDCNELLTGVRHMVRRTFTEDIEVVLEQGPAGLRCMADRAQLTTALLNLCINARDAMPDGGKLTLRVTGADNGAGSSVCFSVEDTGHGMSEHTREHATEPFFTTKAVGDGSGLGLSMVFGFANQSGGRLQIQSEIDLGTRIDLYLPETQQDMQPSKAAEDTSVMPAAGRVLVVEDDDLIRAHVERQLRTLGHSVTVAADGPEALRVLSGEQGFDLLITDVVMPNGMNGRELAQHARALDPRMRILLTSGHNEDAVLRGNRGHDGDDFLPKPYRRAEFERKVSALLQRLPA